MSKSKKTITVFLSLLLFVGMLPVYAEDFASNEAHYRQLCSGPNAKDNKKTCLEFNQYLQQKIKDSEGDIDKYKGQISQYKDDLAKQVEIANEYQEKIETLDLEIKKLESDIVNLEQNIKVIEEEIVKREEEIADKDRIIIERMIKTQTDMRFGYEIDFLFKAQSFETLISSMSVVSDIMDFETRQIEEINRLIEKQKTDKETLIVQQDTINLYLVDIEKSKEETIILKAEVDIAVANYQTLMAEIEAKQSQSYADANAIRNTIAKNQEAMNKVEDLGSSTGFTRPIAGGRINARVWAYPAPWSALHLGYDYGAPVGTPIRAAANGIVLYSVSPCPTYGFLGNSCGRPGLSGGGNQVHTLVTVNDKLYAINYSHMESGSPIATGTIITGGTQIGRIGTSGNSTGPHAHVEVYYLGVESIQSYTNRWNGNLGHNVGFSLARRCMDNGNSAPCRMDPGEVFGRN